MLKIYIAGKISGTKDYEERFKKAEKEIVSLGHTPLNPCKNKGFRYKEYIDMGLAELMQCDAILMLPGWQSSSGAGLEFNYAAVTGMKVFDGFEKLISFHEETCKGQRKDYQPRLDLEV